MIPLSKKFYPLVLGLGVCASTILAQTPGAFTAAGNMTMARSWNSSSAILLPNGKVLIIQGPDPIGQYASSAAELYDPATRTFTATGGTARVSGLATLLGNGKVLITGNTAQLYDPATGTLAPAGSYVGPFYYGPFFYPGTATLLPDGRVLIAGSACDDCFIEHEELYDPVTETFKVAGKPHTFDSELTIGFYHTATLLPNGKVLLAGGSGGEFPPYGDPSRAELYDPSTDTFTDIGNMTVPRAEHTATLLPNGTVLLAGGYPRAGGGPFDGSTNAEVYDPATGTFSSIGNMATPRTLHTATLLPNGTVLLAGGYPFADAEVYDPATGMFSSTGNMATPRYWQAATLLPDGTVLMTGGLNDRGVELASAELYTPRSLIPVPVPMLLSLSGDGQGQGAIQHAGAMGIASADDPAVPGEYLFIYLTGLADGSMVPPQVVIGGRLAEVTFFGNVPGYTGLNVVLIRMPSGVTPGPAVPVRLTYLGRPSNQVTIGVALDAALQKAVAAMKTAAGTDSLNFWQWAWYWQYLPPFNGAPAGFGVIGSISPDVMEQIIVAGGGDPRQNISVEQWVGYFGQVVPR